jgi:hypothetical protein
METKYGGNKQPEAGEHRVGVHLRRKPFGARPSWAAALSFPAPAFQRKERTNPGRTLALKTTTIGEQGQ